MKKLLLLLATLVICTLVVACNDPAGSQVSGPNKVKLVGAFFAASTITIHKGETITFVDDANNGALHVLVVGKNGGQESENGAPDFGGFAGERIDVGEVWTSPPWNRAGVFHVTCTAHPTTMNLIVIVS